MSKQVKQLTPLLTVFETAPGCYSIRLAEISKRATFLSIEVAKLLPDARSLQVITPTDMKVFDLTGDVTSQSPEKKGGDFSPPGEKGGDFSPSSEIEPDVIGPMPQPMDMEQVVEIAQQEEQRINGEEKRFRKRKPVNSSPAGFDEPCQRCSGSGTVQMLMEGGHPATGVCPVCQGEKVVRRFGARR